MLMSCLISEGPAWGSRRVSWARFQEDWTCSGTLFFTLYGILTGMSVEAAASRVGKGRESTLKHYRIYRTFQCSSMVTRAQATTQFWQAGVVPGRASNLYDVLQQVLIRPSQAFFIVSGSPGHKASRPWHACLGPDFSLAFVVIVCLLVCRCRTQL